MNIHDFENIQPFIRMVKIKKSLQLQGDWKDLDHVMIYIAHGSVVYGVLNHSYHLNTGDFILLPPLTPHRLYGQSNDNLVQYILHFDLFTDPMRRLIPHQSAHDMVILPELPECEKLLRNTSYAATIPPEERFSFENLFLQMYREFSLQKMGCQKMLQGMAIQAIFTLLRCLPAERLENGAEYQKKSKPWMLVRSAMEYIWLHYGEPLDNSSIAQAIDVSPNYLTKIFRQHIGTSLHKYVTSYRLEQAQQMLMTGKYNITEVSQKCGFSSIHIFSKLFKQECGISPSAYVALLPENQKKQSQKADYALNKHIFYNL